MVMVQDPLHGKRDGLRKGSQQPRVEYGRGCAVRPGTTESIWVVVVVTNSIMLNTPSSPSTGDAAAGNGQAVANADPARARVDNIHDDDHTDWVEAYKQVVVFYRACRLCFHPNSPPIPFPQAPDHNKVPYTYPRESSDNFFTGTKDRFPEEDSTLRKAAGYVGVAAQSATDAMKNAANNVLHGTGRGDRQLRPANMDLPQDYESVHIKGRTVVEEGKERGDGKMAGE